MLRDDSKRNQQSDVHFNESLDSMLKMLNRLEETTTKLSDQFLNLTNGENPKARKVRQELVGVLWNPGWSPKPADGTSVTACTTASQNEVFYRTIVEQIKFEAIKRREEAILQAYADSFEWIFDSNANRGNTEARWSSFTEWLAAADSKLYWITGKPGSGKSTLMKFILNHPRLELLLREWAGDLPLHIVSFYFWNAGSDYLQKTLEGFIRTILYQILSQSPALVAQVAPRHHAMFSILRDPHAAFPNWTYKELWESLQLMLSNCEIRIALWVDGLDEIEGTPVQITEVLREIGSHKCVKICAASREWPEFEDVFGSYPLLRIHELSRMDIESFTMGKLESSQGFRQLRAIAPEDSAKLALDVIQKAQGVFIWVSLVVRSLLDDLSDGATLSDLQSTLDSLPEDISDLYGNIWAKLQQTCRNIQHSSRIFQMKRASIGPLHFLTLWLADEDKPTDFNIKSISPSSKKGIADIIKRRIGSRTRGIIEMSPDEHVDFLHRTARDWAFQPNVWEAICGVGPNSIHFSPDLALLRTTVILMQDVSNYPGRSLGDFWEVMLKCLIYAARLPDSETITPKLISILNKLDDVGVQSSKEMGFLRVWWTDNKKRVKGTLHWSAAVSQECKENNTFIGLVASFGIVAYVKNQAASNQSVALGVGEGNRSILDNAARGFKGSKDTVLGPFRAKYGTIESDLNGRVEIVRFLFETGIYLGRVRFDELWDLVRKAEAEGVDCAALTDVLKKRESVKGVVSSAVQRFVRR